MPASIPYDSVCGSIRYDTDADGTLHITIPPQYPGLLQMNSLYWIGSTLLVPVAILACLWLKADTQSMLSGVCASILFGVMLLCFGWIGAYKSKFKIWIDATPDQVTIRRQFRARVSSQNFLRADLLALDVGQSIDYLFRNKLLGSRPGHDRYGWITSPSQTYITIRLEHVARRLRTLLQLPDVLPPTP